MGKHPLEPAFAKIERAETHIKDLNTAIRAFSEARPYRLASKLNEQRTEEIWSIVVNPIPAHIECMAADAVHNLRTPLDKMLAAGFRNAAIHMPKASIQRLKFPGVEHPNELKNILTCLEEHLTGPVIKFLYDAEPYKEGAGHIIWAVNTLDNRDKHRALLEPIKLGFSTAEHRQVKVAGGFLLRMGSRRGKHMVPVPDAKPGAWHMHQPVHALQPILRLAVPSVADHFLEFMSPYDDMEIFTTTPGAKVDADVKPVLNIAFSDVERFEGEPVVKALETMRKAIKTVLDEFRTAFF
jgi:hypothetical protein